MEKKINKKQVLQQKVKQMKIEVNQVELTMELNKSQYEISMKKNRNEKIRKINILQYNKMDSNIKKVHQMLMFKT